MCPPNRPFATIARSKLTELPLRKMPRLLRYIVEKGSIAIDGISLTVASVTKSSFSVSLIPHTGTCTTLLSKRPGDPVNLETDVIGKYVEKLMQPTTPPLTASMLQKYGF